MRIRGKLTIRNDHLLVAREKRGITQKQAAELCGMSLQAYAAIERLDFQNRKSLVFAAAIAGEFGLDVEVVMPPLLAGKNCRMDRASVTAITPDRLLEQTQSQLFTKELPPGEVLEEKEKNQTLRQLIQILTYRQREIIKLRFGLDGRVHTFEEVGRIFKITKERARMVECQAIRKLHQHDLMLGGRLRNMELDLKGEGRAPIVERDWIESKQPRRKARGCAHV